MDEIMQLAQGIDFLSILSGPVTKCFGCNKTKYFCSTVEQSGLVIFPKSDMNVSS